MKDLLLETGLRVLAIRRPSVPLVEMRLHIPLVGDAAQARVLGAAMLSGAHLHKKLALIGGELVADVDAERLQLAGSVLADGLPGLLVLLAEVLTGATYSGEVLAKERERTAQHMALLRAEPSLAARAAFRRQCYGDHPSAQGPPESGQVAAVTAEQVRLLHDRAVVPRGSLLLLVGDLDPSATVEAVELALSDWRSDHGGTARPPLPAPALGGITIVHRPEATQSQIRLGLPGVARTHPDHPALHLANLVLGGYFSSRLVANLRERNGYTYSVRSNLDFLCERTMVTIETDVVTESTMDAIHEIRRELDRLAAEPLAGDELDAARRYAIGSQLLSTSSQAGLASALAGIAATGLDLDWFVTLPQRLEAVTADQVVSIAAAHLTADRCGGIVLGNAPALASEIGDDRL